MPSERPIIVGVGQVTNKTDDLAQAREPLALMEEAARLAERDADASGLLAKIDSLQVVNVVSWPSADPPADLAARIGASPGEKIYTTLGGNTPQWLVNETAERIASGRVRLALIAGAEALHSARRARKLEQQLDWSPRGRPEPNAGDNRPGSSDMENKHGAFAPIQVYPLFENALRAKHGHSIAAHQREVGELCARFSLVAAQHPNAWFPEARTAEEIATPGPANRMVGFPYPKFMNAIMEVDQGAALLMTSESYARELGIAEDRWVYHLGGGEAIDHWYFTERVNYHSSPAIKIAGRRALETAGATIGDIACFDLYSCFPCAVQLGRDALGITRDDPRSLTVTGGLPYFGGAGNNYTTHAIATMVEKLRADPDKLGLVSALGWFATKHAIGVYGAKRPEREWSRGDVKADQAEVDAMPHPDIAEVPNGPATIETYTVVYGRDGTPAQGIVIGRLEYGQRFIANTPADESLFETMVSEEFIGAKGAVRHDESSGTNVFAP
jgi:acetyl-CoA C-acetyltransferase